MNVTPEYAFTTGGRIYWNLRNRLGQFVTRHGFNRSTLATQHAAWRAYLDARRVKAEQDTRGHLLTRRAFLRGVKADRLLRPGASLASASSELIEWLSLNGPSLSRAQFVAQSAA